MSKQMTSVYINGTKVFALVAQDYASGLKRFEDARFYLYLLKPKGYEVIETKESIHATAVVEGKKYSYWFIHNEANKSFGTLAFNMSTARAMGGVCGLITHLMANYKPFTLVNLTALNAG